MNEIEKILREQIEGYELEYREIEQKLEVAEAGDAKDIFYYASCLEEPIQNKKILFWCKGEQTASDTPRDMFEYLYQTYGNAYEYVWVTKTNKEPPKGLPKEVTFVKKKSKAYWEALACAKYLVGNGVLPASFCKREEQIYVNAMMGAEAFWKEEGVTDVDEASVWLKDVLKADYLISPSNRVDEVAECMIKGAWNTPENQNIGADVQTRIDAENKKVLILANWSVAQEQRYTVAYMIEKLCKEGKDVTVLAKRAEEHLNYTFGRLSEQARKILSRGKMVLGKEDFIFFRMVERHPDIYLQNEKIRSYVRELMHREWNRLGGKESFGCVIVMGKLQWQSYLLADALDVPEKILVDEDTLPDIREKEWQQWQQFISVFDKIVTYADCRDFTKYGTENEKKVVRLPISKKTVNVRDVAYTDIDGKRYFVADSWRDEQCTESFRLVELPERGSCLVNTDEELTGDRREQFEQLLKKEDTVYFVGEYSSEYAELAGKGYNLIDPFVLRHLYMLGTAPVFFERFRCYYGKQAEEYDVMEELCKLYGVPVMKGKEWL